MVVRMERRSNDASLLNMDVDVITAAVRVHEDAGARGGDRYTERHQRHWAPERDL